MKKNVLTILIIQIAIILIIFAGIYLLIFNSSLSLNQSDWGDFGSYFAGTIGVCFSLLGVILIYYTFFQQRKQQFENTFQQYISNYYSLLNLIKERWLHTTSEKVFKDGERIIDLSGNDTGNPIYQTGREIFGNAIGYIATSSNKEHKFIEIFSIHNNVFQHYCSYLVELFNIIDNNNELKNKMKIIYIDRFLSILSTYELVFFAYYIKYLHPRENAKTIIESLEKKFKVLNLTDKTPYKEQIEFIIKELNGIKKKTQPTSKI